METDRHLFRKCLLCGQVLMTWAERHSLVPPGPAAPSVVTIVRLHLHFGLAHVFQPALQCVSGVLYLWHCLQRQKMGLFTRPESAGFVCSQSLVFLLLI